MICPSCGGDTQVYDSRPSGGRVRRRRKCKICEKRFTTYESHSPSTIDAEQTIQRLRVIVFNLSQIIAELRKE